MLNFHVLKSGIVVANTQIKVFPDRPIWQQIKKRSPGLQFPAVGKTECYLLYFCRQ